MRENGCVFSKPNNFRNRELAERNIWEFKISLSASFAARDLARNLKKIIAVYLPSVIKDRGIAFGLPKWKILSRLYQSFKTSSVPLECKKTSKWITASRWTRCKISFGCALYNDEVILKFFKHMQIVW